MISPESRELFRQFETHIFLNDVYDAKSSAADLMLIPEADRSEVSQQIAGIVGQLVNERNLNALRIGLCMTFLDTRQLCPQLRDQLGLAAEFSPLNSFSAPTITSPWNNKKNDVNSIFRANCYESEKHLKKRHERLEFAELYKSKNSSGRPIVLYDSLLVELMNVYTGYATKTVEFVNGSSLIEGCFYVLTNRRLRRKLHSSVRKSPETRQYFIDRESHDSGIGILMAYPKFCELSLSRVLYNGYQMSGTVDDPYYLPDNQVKQSLT